eukprot:CAMPEP_0203764274 /NCGR_PEP_ID=MMETSP0098-20131031/17570_1 /ASSEMBLY_ACC=CAM_ASM_000208 /TAXON_ID=96639 /ORGANISM=" , Strain NY0313808BC1" /LENGTH=477 /DNA_ID=CAMNT_0050660065 /DNA_START=1134 /DNA_END=2567 /DNA_ORIENTATION=+
MDRSEDNISITFSYHIRPKAALEQNIEQLRPNNVKLAKSTATNSSCGATQEDISFRGYLVVQADNRLYESAGGLHEWAEEKKSRALISFVHNMQISKSFGYKYRLFVPPKWCYVPNSNRPAGYWCKVISMIESAKAFPNATGILFLDSDAYLAHDIGYFVKHVTGSGMTSKSPFFVGGDTSRWKRIIETYNPRIYRASINSGVTLFSPQSQHAHRVLDQWWNYESTHISEFENRQTCLGFQFRLSKGCGTVPTRSELFKVILDILTRGKMTKAADTLQAGKPEYIIHKCFSLERPEGSLALENSISKQGENLVFQLHNISDTKTIVALTQLEKLFKIHANKNIPLADCKIEEVNSEYAETYDFMYRWPGEQERLQSVIEKIPNSVSILPTLQVVDQISDLSECNNAQCLVWHACQNATFEEYAAKKVASALSQGFPKHTKNEWSQMASSIPKCHFQLARKNTFRRAFVHRNRRRPTF